MLRDVAQLDEGGTGRTSAKFCEAVRDQGDGEDGCRLVRPEVHVSLLRHLQGVEKPLARVGGQEETGEGDGSEESSNLCLYNF